MTLEELAQHFGRLADATEANTKAQVEAAANIREMRTEFKVWRQTRCDDHHGRLDAMEADVTAIRGELNRAIGKAAGAVAAVTFVVTILATKIAPHLHG